MSNFAWRTVVTKDHENLSMRENQMVIASENDEMCFPIEQIREVLVASNTGSISFPLLIRLAEQNTKVIFCDRKKTPLCELNTFHGNFETAGRMMDQATWTNRKKSAVWRPNCENENSPANRPSSNTGITVLLWVSTIVTDRILIIFPVI